MRDAVNVVHAGGDLAVALGKDHTGAFGWYNRGGSILIDVARGLHFLHCNKVAHRCFSDLAWHIMFLAALCQCDPTLPVQHRFTKYVAASAQAEYASRCIYGLCCLLYAHQLRTSNLYADSAACL